MASGCCENVRSCAWAMSGEWILPSVAIVPREVDLSTCMDAVLGVSCICGYALILFTPCCVMSRHEKTEAEWFVVALWRGNSSSRPYRYEGHRVGRCGVHAVDRCLQWCVKTGPYIILPIFSCDMPWVVSYKQARGEGSNRQWGPCCCRRLHWWTGSPMNDSPINWPVDLMRLSTQHIFAMKFKWQTRRKVWWINDSSYIICSGQLFSQPDRSDPPYIGEELSKGTFDSSLRVSLVRCMGELSLCTDVVVSKFFFRVARLRLWSE